MANEPTAEEKRKPWQWPAKWVREEKFWQDVATRTLSAIFAAGLLYIGAIALGYIQGPTGRGVVALVMSVVVLPGLFLWALIAHMSRRYRKQIEQGEYRLIGYSWWVAIPLTVSMVGLLYVSIALVQWWARG